MEGRSAEASDPGAGGGDAPALTGLGRFRAPRIRPGASTRSDGATRSSFGRWLWDWTKSIFVALVLFLLIRTFVVEAFQIPTASMENTLLVGDFLLVNKMVYGAEIPGTDVGLPGFGAPSRGDVVVFEPPRSAAQPPRTNYVKRIIGLPGDTLRMRHGRLFLNRLPLREPYLKPASTLPDASSVRFAWQRRFLTGPGHPSRYAPTRNTWGPLVVPSEHYFVMGDNRSNSEDSRYWGFVPRDAIKGRPMLVYYSYDREDEGLLVWLTKIRWGRFLRGVD